MKSSKHALKCLEFSVFLTNSTHSCKVSIRRGTPNERLAEKPIVTDNLILVGWDGPNDPLNPVNESVGRKLFMTVLVSLIALSVTAASAIDACGVREYSEHFQVSEVVGSLATGMLKNVSYYNQSYTEQL